MVNETLRRGMSIAYGQHEKPAPPVRRTPSISTTVSTSSTRTNVRLNRCENVFQSETIIETDFPPPPDDFLIQNENQNTTTNNSARPAPTSLLEEIQRGAFKLRKTMIDRDRSAPRLR